MTMKLRHLHLILFILGAVVPCTQFVPFLVGKGLDFPLIFQQLFASRISAFLGLDVILSVVVLQVLIISEGRENNIKHLWLPVLVTLQVGVSAGLPLYL